jgi:hypothetical protein
MPPTVMVNELLMPEVSPVAVPLRVKLPAVPLILHPAKFATPAVATNGLVVQLRAPLPEAMAKVIDALEFVPEVTVLPPLSCTVTTGWVPHTAPLAPPPGEVVKANLVAVPKVTAN